MVHHGFFFNGAAARGGHLLLLLLLLAVGAAAISALVLVVRDRPTSGAPASATPSAPPRTEASRILDERYARGEIDDDEYQRRSAVLRSLA